MTCSKCNTHNSDDASYCYECGSPMSNASPKVSSDAAMSNKITTMKAMQKYLAKGQIDKAIAECERFIMESHDGDAYNTIGDLYLKKGDSKKAAESYLNAATYLRRGGFSLKALAIYKKVLNVDPSNAEALVALGELSEEKGLMTDAIKYYLTAADSFLKQDNKEELYNIYQHILTFSPDNKLLRDKVNEILRKQGLENFKKEQKREEVTAMGIALEKSIPEIQEVNSERFAPTSKEKEVQNKSTTTNQNNHQTSAGSCPQCNTNIIEGAEFCIKCGYRLVSSSVCPKCKRDNPQDAFFCAGCGNKLNVPVNYGSQPKKPEPQIYRPQKQKREEGTGREQYVKRCTKCGQEFGNFAYSCVKCNQVLELSQPVDEKSKSYPVRAKTTSEERYVERIVDLLNNFINGVNDVMKRFHLNPNISEKILRNAISTFAPGAQREKVFCFFNLSSWSPGKSGMLLTDKRIYWTSRNNQPYSLHYSAIEAVFYRKNDNKPMLILKGEGKTFSIDSIFLDGRDFLMGEKKDFHIAVHSFLKEVAVFNRNPDITLEEQTKSKQDLLRMSSERFGQGGTIYNYKDYLEGVEICIKLIEKYKDDDIIATTHLHYGISTFVEAVRIEMRTTFIDGLKVYKYKYYSKEPSTDCRECNNAVSGKKAFCDACIEAWNFIDKKIRDYAYPDLIGKCLQCQVSFNSDGRQMLCSSCLATNNNTELFWRKYEGKSEQQNHPGTTCCPSCGSTSVTTQQQGFSVAKGLVGDLIVPFAGILAGFIGKNKMRYKCMNCGFTGNWM